MYLLRHIPMGLFVVIMPKVYSSVKLQDVIFSFSFFFCLQYCFCLCMKNSKIMVIIIIDQ